MKTLLLIAVVLLAFSSAMGASPTRQEVSAAIAQFEQAGTSLEAARVIVTFAEQSDDVQISITPKTVPWLKEKWGLESELEQGIRSMLLAAYLAGNIRSQLATGKPSDDPYAGWIFACRKYAQYRSKISFSSPSIEALEERRTKGTLKEYARDVLKKGEPDGAANGSHPIGPETNRTSPAAGSRR